MARHRRAGARLLTTLVLGGLGSALLTALGSTLAFVLTEEAIRPELLVPILVVFLAFVSGLLILLGIAALVYDGFRDFNHKQTEYSLLKRAVPTLVTFERRTDRFCVRGNGDATLDWTFELRCDPKDHIEQLTFPIYGEVGPGGNPPIKVTKLLINGKPRDFSRVYEPHQRRHKLPEVESDTSPVPDAEVLEFGILRVPVKLDKSHDECKVEMSFEFNLSVPEKDGDQFLVDIPYITRNLTVVIASEGQYAVHRALRNDIRTVDAKAGLMLREDPDESNYANEHAWEDKGTLRWEMDLPKLGYQYVVNYRLESVQGTGTTVELDPASTRTDQETSV
jgi:hypothetical protein